MNTNRKIFSKIADDDIFKLTSAIELTLSKAYSSETKFTFPFMKFERIHTNSNKSLFAVHSAIVHVVSFLITWEMFCWNRTYIMRALCACWKYVKRNMAELTFFTGDYIMS